MNIEWGIYISLVTKITLLLSFFLFLSLWYMPHSFLLNVSVQLNELACYLKWIAGLLTCEQYPGQILRFWIGPKRIGSIAVVTEICVVRVEDADWKRTIIICEGHTGSRVIYHIQLITVDYVPRACRLRVAFQWTGQVIRFLKTWRCMNDLTSKQTFVKTISETETIL